MLDMSPEKMTPMMQQYLKVKQDYKDTILFYRLGDFYEMFFDDAKTASKELELALTGRDCGQQERAPMCGVPYHSADAYIARLIEKGYKVAICEQMEDPATAKGLVTREVIRKITPGTLIDSSMLDEKTNNFIAGVYCCADGYGLSFCDMSTGQMTGSEFSGAGAKNDVMSELSRCSPRELLMSPEAFEDVAMKSFITDNLGTVCEKQAEEDFDLKTCSRIMDRQFAFAGGKPESVESRPMMIRAAGALLSYLYETQKNDLSHICEFQVDERGSWMELDLSVRRSLELTVSQRGDKKGTLLWVLDFTKTPMGSRLIRQWIEKPLLDIIEIKDRQQAVKSLVENGTGLGDLSDSMSGMLDMERTIARIVYGTAGGRDMRALWQALCALPQIKQALCSMNDRTLSSLGRQLDVMEDVRDYIDSAIAPEPPFSLREGNVIRDGFSKELDELRGLINGGASRLDEIERAEKERTGIRTLKVGYNRVFGYYIEVSKSFMDQVPDEYIRKQTLANAERYITPALKELEGEILSAGERAAALEYQLFTKIREDVAGHFKRVQQSAAAVAKADVLCSFAKAAVKYNYVCPEVDRSDVIEIKEGRHAVVERVLTGELFVPNDTYLDCGHSRTHIITGPNMSGKSTYMRQVALITVMAQCGSFVPAAYARIGLVDRVFTRVGASDDLFTGRSTFMVEMNEVSDILANATPRSLLILDEIGRGTSTFDGMAIARAVLEYVNDKKTLGARTMFATHYHRICMMAEELEGVKNFNIVVKKKNDTIVFIKKVVPGAVGDSYGVDVAKLAGIPERIVKRARALLREMEKDEERIPRAPETVEEDQISMGDIAGRRIVDEIMELAPDTLTPIEALNVLYKLREKAVKAGGSEVK